jgi:hypothetical protein
MILKFLQYLKLTSNPSPFNVEKCPIYLIEYHVCLPSGSEGGFV